jgi:CRP-like cAMP-binding protein
MNDITDYLKKNHLTESQIKHVLESGTFVDMKKGDFFSEDGKVCDKIGFLIKGILYTYSIDDKGDKSISHFFYTPNNYLVIDHVSYEKNCKSNNIIEALEETKLFVIDRKSIDQLYAEMPQLIDMEREMAKIMHSESLQLIRIFQTSNAEERIKILRNKAPELFSKVPYSYLASFLGIHRNTFNAALKKV